MVVDLVFDASNTNAAAGETLTGIEGIRGRNYASYGDFLYGDIHDNRIWGLAGNDILTGRAGADRLFGGEGDDQLLGGLNNDWLVGGAGADFFVFSTALGSNVDHIVDFKPADDTIRLDDAVFAALSVGPLADAAFRANASGQAQDASDRIIYETDTGKLFYDKDGSGAADAILFAILDNKANITADDFEII
jgi:Ca2+-binding RTX toxin-like protein